MNQFKYVGRDKQGQSVEGMIEGSSALHVAQKLKGADIIPINIAPISQNDGIEDFFKNIFGFAKPTNGDLILFTQQLHTLIKGGVPLRQALKLIYGVCKQQKLRSIVTDIIISLESGHRLSQSLRKHSDVFPSIYCAMIEVGESTGQLEASTAAIVNYLLSEQDTKRRIKNALRYPLIVLGAVIFALIIINIWVVPSFRDFFDAFHAVLPLPTRILIGFSDFILHYGIYCIVMVTGIGIFLVKYSRTVQGQWYWAYVKIHLPFVGRIIRRAINARFCRAFAMVLDADIPLLQSFHVVAAALDNRYLARKIDDMRFGLLNGESFYKAAQRSALFDPIVLQMISVGQETGRMHDVLFECALHYEKEIDYELKKMGDLIEPILIAIIAILVFILALGVFLPMWDISTVSLGSETLR